MPTILIRPHKGKEFTNEDVLPVTTKLVLDFGFPSYVTTRPNAGVYKGTLKIKYSGQLSEKVKNYLESLGSIEYI